MLEVLQRETACFAVDAQLVESCEITAFGMTKIVCGRNVPIALTVHYESKVLYMVVLIAANQIEDDATELLLNGALRHIELTHRHKELLIRTSAAFIVIKMRERGKRLEKILAAPGIVIEASRHEMVAAILTQ